MKWSGDVEHYQTRYNGDITLLVACNAHRYRYRWAYCAQITT